MITNDSQNQLIEPEPPSQTLEKITFAFEVKDTILPKNLYINIRNNNDYEFSNLYIITELKFPNNTLVIDTLQYEMADISGMFLGNGFSEIKENKFPQAVY